MERDDNSTHRNSAPVQIVRLEAGNSVGPLLHVCVGIVAVMMVCIGLSIWAVFTALSSREALNLAREQYRADIAGYQNAAEMGAFWRQRIEATLIAQGVELPAAKRKGN